MRRWIVSYTLALGTSPTSTMAAAKMSHVVLRLLLEPRLGKGVAVALPSSWLHALPMEQPVGSLLAQTLQV